MKKIRASAFKPLPVFILLFSLYHLAEYAFMFHQSIPGFFAAMGCFFAAFWLIINRIPNENAKKWALTGPNMLRSFVQAFAFGTAGGSLAFLSALTMQSTCIVAVPAPGFFIQQTLLLAFGSLLTSFSEDIFTRCFVYRYIRHLVKPGVFILISTLIYVLNHIYRLGDGPLLLGHLTILGLLLSLPLLKTGNVAATTGIHWGLNVVYQITGNVIQTENGHNPFPAPGILVIIELLMIPVAARLFK